MLLKNNINPSFLTGIFAILVNIFSMGSNFDDDLTKMQDDKVGTIP